MRLKKIKGIEFRVMSPEFIRKMSVIEIKTPETYDKDGYPMDGGLMDAHLGVINPGLRCKTCGQKMKDCPGHFGRIELVRPVIHSEYARKIEELLTVTCRECGRIALKDEELEQLAKKYSGEELTKKIIAKAKNVARCPHCKAIRKKLTVDRPTGFYYNKERIFPTDILEWLEKIPDKDLEYMGYNVNIVRPTWFIVTALPVPPINVRPSITLESGLRSEDDLTHKLVDIIRTNERLAENLDSGAPQLIIEDLWDLLQYHVTTYFNNNTPNVAPAKHRSGRPLQTLVQRLKGKKGRFRHNLTGKRVNFGARSTISPDSFISINEVGVPYEIAKELTVPEAVTTWNKKEIIKMIKETELVQYIVRPNGQRKRVTEENKKEIIDELDVGYKIERSLKNGDIALFNRQPSLHRLSMLAHRVRIMPGKTLRINPVVCKPYNADFDGDEMNLHIPQTEEGKTEAEELMLVQNQVISPRYGAPVIILDEDGVSGCFVLTLKSTEFNKEEATGILYEMDITDLPKPDRGKNFSGKLIFSQLLPKDLNIEYESQICKVIQKIKKCKECKKEKCPYDAYVKIKNGLLVSGVIDAGSLGEAKGKLVDVLAREYPSEVIERFYDKINRVNSILLTRKGMTVGLDEYEVSNKIKEAREKVIEEALKEAEKLVKQYERGTLAIIPGKTLAESFELKMMQLAAEIKAKIEAKILEEKLSFVYGHKPVYNSIVMIVSGSRGSSTNLMNIAGFWGQASVREGRPKRGYKDRLISLNERGDVGLIAGGFIKSNFLEGMSPKEYFYHSMGGRQGEVDTGVSTKVSGYLYRRLANALKDLSVKGDNTVRTAFDRVIQYLYGEDGIFPMNTKKGKSIDLTEEYARFEVNKG